jgi:hypothetical protein
MNGAQTYLSAKLRQVAGSVSGPPATLNLIMRGTRATRRSVLSMVFCAVSVLAEPVRGRPPTSGGVRDTPLGTVPRSR